MVPPFVYNHSVQYIQDDHARTCVHNKRYIIYTPGYITQDISYIHLIQDIAHVHVCKLLYFDNTWSFMPSILIKYR